MTQQEFILKTNALVVRSLEELAEMLERQIVRNTPVSKEGILAVTQLVRTIKNTVVVEEVKP